MVFHRTNSSFTKFISLSMAQDERSSSITGIFFSDKSIVCAFSYNGTVRFLFKIFGEVLE